TSRGLDLLHPLADDLAFLGHDDDLVVIPHHRHAYRQAVLGGRLDVEDTLPPPPLPAVLLQGRAFAVAFFGGSEEGLGVLHDHHADDRVVLAQAAAPDALAGAAHFPDLLLLESDAHALPGGQEDVLFAVGDLSGDQLIALGQGDGDDAAGPG